MAYNYHQGFYKPKNPEKYKGNSSNIVYRSSLEYKVMKEFDNNPDIISWASEEYWFVIPYLDKATGARRRYFPDFWVKKRNSDGTTSELLIEVKPHAQTKAPPVTKNGKLDKRHIKAALTYATNISKWQAAEAYCEAKGWGWQILTEKHIG